MRGSDRSRSGIRSCRTPNRKRALGFEQSAHVEALLTKREVLLCVQTPGEYEFPGSTVVLSPPSDIGSPRKTCIDPRLGVDSSRD